MKKEEYLKLIEWLFPKNEDDKYPMRILVKSALKNNFNFHNKRVLKKMCMLEVYRQAGITVKTKKKLHIKG